MRAKKVIISDTGEYPFFKNIVLIKKTEKKKKIGREFSCNAPF